MGECLNFKVWDKDYCIVTVKNGKLIKTFRTKFDGIASPKDGSEGSIKEFFANRVFPSTRVGVKELLNELNIPVYNPYLICRKTKGILNDDYYWIQFEDDNFTYSDFVKYRTINGLRL